MSSALPLALVSVVGSTAYLTIFVALHVLPTGYDPVRHAVSDYAVGRYGRWFRVGLWSSSASVLALAIGLAIAVGSPPLGANDLILLGLITFARLGMSVFPTSLEGQPLHRNGILHYLFAIAAFTFTYLAISHLTGPLTLLTPWNSLARPLRWLAWLVIPALAAVVVTMVTPLRRVFGLFERIFLVTTNLWFLLVGIDLLVSAM